MKLRKRIVSIIVAGLMLAGYAPMMPEGVFGGGETISASAASATKGTWRPNSSSTGFEWTLEDGVLTVNGEGTLSGYWGDYQISYEGHWNPSGVESVIIGDKVTGIGVSAFDRHGSLKEITIPANVTRLGYSIDGKYLFDENSNPKRSDIIINCESGTAAYDYAVKYNHPMNSSHEHEFVETKVAATCTESACTQYKCSVCGLTKREYTGEPLGHNYVETVIPPNGTERGYTLHECSVCGDSYKDNYVEPTGPERFFRYSKVSDNEVCITGYTGEEKDVVIPDELYGLKVVSIGKEAFRSHSYLESVKLSKNVKSIGDKAFSQCSNLESVTLGKGLKSIGDRAFESCHRLTKINLPDGLESIGKVAFYSTAFTEITIPNTVTSIGEDAFAGCAITELTIPGSVKEIREYAFSECGSLQSVIIEDGVERIAARAFLNCSNIKTLKIPGSVKKIGEWLFYYSHNIEELTLGNGIESIEKNAFDLKYPINLTIPASVTSISSNAFGYSFSGTIYCRKDSAAEKFAINNNFKYQIITCAHDFEQTEVVAPTCTEQGYTLYRCKECGIGKKDTYTKATGHNLVGLITAPTCSRQGFTTYSCTKCSYSYDTDYTATLAHNYKKGTVVSPTCTEKGYTIYTCADCGAKKKDSYTKALGHSYSGFITAPTCTHGGFTTFTCTRCSDSYDTDYTDKIPHSYELSKVIAPTTDHYGYSLYVCSACGDSYEGNIIDSLYSMDECTVTLSANNLTYDGTEKRPTVTVTCGAVKFTEGYDFTVVYSKNINAGTAAATVKGKQNCVGTKTISFTISPLSISNAQIKLSSTEFTYNGTNKKPAVSLNYNGRALTQGKDFTVNYPSEAVSPGTYNVPINGIGNFSGTVYTNYTINPISIENAVITTGKSSYPFTGNAIIPAATVKVGKKTLVLGTDYRLSYSNNTTAGTATITVTGMGGYSGTARKNFTIKPVAISGTTVTLGRTSYVFDGTRKTPTVTVKLGSKALVQNRDFTVTYAHNLNAGTATVTITGKTSLTGALNKTFKITAASVASAKVTPNTASCIYDGTKKKPSVTVKVGKNTLKSGTDYTLAYANNINVGTATVVVVGKGNYTGKVKGTFKIQLDIRKAAVSGVKSSYTYTGNYIKPQPVLKYGGKTLVNGTDYTLSYTNNVKVGLATVTMTGKGKYAFAIARKYKIKAMPITKAAITLGHTSYAFDGTRKTPGVTVKIGSKVLKNGTDYTVTYSHNLNAGTASVVITGKGAYGASVTKTFKITPASITKATITLSQTNYISNGTARTPAATVTLNKTKLVSGTNFTVSYKNNKASGTATAVITGKGNYTGTVNKTFKITGFAWGSENWNFKNSSTYFAGSTYRKQISSSYQTLLKNHLTNSEYQTVFIGTNGRKAKLDETWGGSCYGMSALMLLASNGLLPYSKYQSNATSIHTFSAPKSNTHVSSLITYYHMLQFKQPIQNIYRTSYYQYERIETLIKELNKHESVIIGLSQGTFGHAVLALGYERGKWSYDGTIYNLKIRICDPNSANQKNSNYYMYAVEGWFYWVIPQYDVGFNYGGYIDLVSGDPGLINNGGLISGTTYKGSTGYSASLEAYSAASNRTVSKTSSQLTNNKTVRSTAANDIVETKFHSYSGTDQDSTDGYVLQDEDSAYKITQSSAQKLSADLTYENCLLGASSDKGTQAVFDKDGYVSVSGKNAGYSLSMTFDVDYPTDWFNCTVSGTASDASLKKTMNGWIVSADNLNNVNVKVYNKNDSAGISFSTKYKSALIYEIDKNTVGIAVDTDNNGTYETTINNPTSALCTAKGNAVSQFSGGAYSTAVMKSNILDIKAA